jgi:hypothetical protein
LKTAIRFLGEGGDAVLPLAFELELREGGETSLGQDGDSSIGSDPEVTVLRGVKRRDGVVGQTVLRGVAREPSVVEAAQSAVGPHPETAFAAPVKRTDKIAGKTIGLRVRRRNLAMLEAADAAPVRAHPEGVSLPLYDRPDLAFLELLGEPLEADSVESAETALRSQPEVAIARLQDRLDRVLRQSLALAPQRDAIVRDVPFRVQRPQRGRGGNVPP